jgi:hypothetical protein
MASWRQANTWEEVLEHPEALRLLNEFQASANKPFLSARQWMELTLGEGGGLGVAMGEWAMNQLGIKTEMSRSQNFDRPFAEAAVAAYGSLLRQGCDIAKVISCHDGCVLEARIPSGFWGAGGWAIATVRRQASQSTVDVTVGFPQLWDPFNRRGGFLDKMMVELPVLAR